MLSITIGPVHVYLTQKFPYQTNPMSWNQLKGNAPTSKQPTLPWAISKVQNTTDDSTQTKQKTLDNSIQTGKRQ